MIDFKSLWYTIEDYVFGAVAGAVLATVIYYNL